MAKFGQIWSVTLGLAIYSEYGNLDDLIDTTARAFFRSLAQRVTSLSRPPKFPPGTNNDSIGCTQRGRFGVGGSSNIPHENEFRHT